MKKLIVLIAVFVLVCASAAADTFLDDFNTYAESLYGIPLIEPVVENVSYKSSEVEITTTGEVRITGDNALSVISAACCALRVIDNPSGMIDQYGRIMHSYFIFRSSGKESRATTDSGILVFFSESADGYLIRLVR